MREEDGLIARLETLATFLGASGLAYESHVANDAAATIQRLLDQTDRDRSHLAQMDALLADERASNTTRTGAGCDR